MAESSIETVIEGHMNPLEYPGQSGNENIDLGTGHTHIRSPAVSSSKYNKRRKCIYLFIGFIVSSCLAAIACAVLVVFIVLKPTVPEIEIIAEPGKVDSYHSGETDDNMLCMNTSVHRINTRARYAAVINFDAQVEKQFRPVCCEDIPDECKGILPYEKTFFPNRFFKTIEKAKSYLNSVDSFMECDSNSLYVFCAKAYPPCITDRRPVMPCKSVCEGVVNSCKDANTSVSIDSKLSCDYYPDGSTDEIVCRSSTHAIKLDIGETFTFSSPNYPGEFPANSRVVWSFTSPEYTRIQIEITGVSINRQLDEVLMVHFAQNPFASRLHMQHIKEDRVVLTHLQFGSVIFQSGTSTNNSTGFTAMATVLRAKDTLLCENNGRPIQEEDLCDGVYDCVDCDQDECTTCDGIIECFDERTCRPQCGYNIIMSTEKANEVIKSPVYSGSYEDCIYTFRAPKRFRVRLEFLEHIGLVSGCNFKYGYGDNPFNVASEFSGIPELSKAIDFPDNIGWIWLASSSDKPGFVVRLSAFSDNLAINVGGNETYILDTTKGSTEIANALERGAITFHSPPGYHLTLSCINDILDVQLNNIMVGVGSEPIKHDVHILYGDFDDVFVFYSNAFWVKMYGDGPYEVGLKITAFPSTEDVRHSVQVDSAAKIVFPIPPVVPLPDCIEVETANEDKQNMTIEEDGETANVTSRNTHAVENGDEETATTERTKIVSTTWVITSVRHPNIAVNFLYFNTSTYSIVNFITIGHGINPDDSSTILSNPSVADYSQKLPEGFIVKHSAFWIRHTSPRDDKKYTMFSLELNGVANVDDLVCPLKFGVTRDDVCDNKYDCPDLSDEMNCGNTAECGQRVEKNRQKRVIGGSEASLGEYPWHGLIMVDGYSHCGSTLLNKDFAITASHCLWHDTNSGSPLTILYASISNRKFSEEHLVREVSLLFLHPHDYSLSDPMDHDIAMIKLKDPVTFTKHVRPACLLKNESQFQPGDKCHISGFGRQVLTELATELHAASLTLYSNDKCMDFQSNLFQITDNIVCAGERDGGTGTCYGDSGGPLVCRDDDDSWYLRGLTSFGHTCAERYRPGAFTRVGRYLDFINTIMDSVSTD